MPSSRATTSATPLRRLQSLPRKSGTPSCDLNPMSGQDTDSKITLDTGPRHISPPSQSTGCAPFIGEALRRFETQSRRRSADSARKQTGQDAEALVANGLTTRGWKILARNFRWIGTEVDIIAAKGATIAAIEVKARRRQPKSMVDLEQLMPFPKRRSLILGLRAFVSRRNVGCTHPNLRVDLALVVGLQSNAQNSKHKPASNPEDSRRVLYFVNVLS